MPAGHPERVDRQSVKKSGAIRRRIFYGQHAHIIPDQGVTDWAAKRAMMGL